MISGRKNGDFAAGKTEPPGGGKAAAMPGGTSLRALATHPFFGENFLRVGSFFEQEPKAKDIPMLTSRDMFTGLPMITAAAFFMQMFNSTILNTALPAIADAMGRSPFSMQLAVISYSLTVALLIPLSGWLADTFGTRRVFLSALAMFVIGSALCAASTTLPLLVAARVVQGVGGAMMVPVSRLTLMRAYTREDFVKVFNFITIPGLVGPVVGPIVGGWLVTYASWPWIFLINIPLGLVILLFSLRSFPDFRQPRGSFDVVGFLLIGAGVLAMSGGLELTGGHGSSPALACGLVVFGVVVILLYVLHARRFRFPIINLKVFSTRAFSVGITGNIVARLGIGSIPFLVPLMLQVGLGYSADIAGLILIAPAVGSVMTKTVVLNILHRFGYRRTLLFLTLSIAAIFMCMSLQQPGWPLMLLVVQLFVQGMLMSGQFTSMNTITLGDLPAETASDGNSLLSVAQNLSVSFGVAVSTALLRVFSSSGELYALHATFIAVGLMAAVSAFIFMLLRPEDGAQRLSNGSDTAAGSRSKGKKS